MSALPKRPSTPQEPVPGTAELFEPESIFDCTARYAWEHRTFNFRLSGTMAEIERHCLDLERRGYKPCLSADNPNMLPKPAARAHAPDEPNGLTEPTRNERGEACCPVHMRILRSGKSGRYCSAIGRRGEAVNAKGYCALRFTDDE